MEITYQEVLAEVYDENAKLKLTIPGEYDESVVIDQYEQHDYEANELPDQEKFNTRYGDRGQPDHIIVPDDDADPAGLGSIHIENKFRMSVISIDGRFRSNQVPENKIPDCSGYIGPGPTESVQSGTNFRVRTARQYKSVYSVEVTSVEFPNNFYTFSAARGNTTFTVNYPNDDNPPILVPYTITIPDGNYEKLVNLDTESPYLPPPLVGQGALISQTTNAGPTGSNEPLTILPSVNGGAIMLPSLVGANSVYDSITKLNFNLNSSGVLLGSPIVTPPPFPDKSTLLGMIQHKLDETISTMPGTSNNTLTRTVNGVPTQIRAVQVGYSKSAHATFFQFNDSFMISSPATITFPVTNDNAYSNGIGYNLGFYANYYTVTQQALPGDHNVQDIPRFCILGQTFPDTIQDRYVFLKLNDWDLIEQQSANQTMLTYFMKIPLSVPKFDVQNDSNTVNTTRKEYFFPQPTNINQIDVSVLDAYGQQIQMLYDTISITLQIKEVLNSATYEALLKYS